ncbi:UNVERIFIED_CONTAM: hypothetical protein Sradi_1337800 [Sesamum radiatum]|uniref:Uncharacterized protein n=1 Tax=Sesamum radiatum TaxID=300843 RepID=A0AAW2UQQ8_SESRA
MSIENDIEVSSRRGGVEPPQRLEEFASNSLFEVSASAKLMVKPSKLVASTELVEVN